MISTHMIKKIRQIEIRTRHLVTDSFAGEYHSVFKGHGIEFDEVRPYQPGDEIRMIDWNVTARTGAPYVKRYIEERELSIFFVVDASGSQDFGSVQHLKRELTAEVAAVLAFAATNNHDKAGLLIFTDQIELFIPPRKGRKHVLRIVRELLAFTPTHRGTNLKLALDTINHLLKRRSVIFLVSDFIADTAQYQRALSITNQRHDLIAVELHDPLETTIANVGLLALEDAESGIVTWADTGNAVWRREFQQKIIQLNQNRQRAFTQANVDRIRLSTGEDYVAPLLGFFEKRSSRTAR